MSRRFGRNQRRRAREALAQAGEQLRQAEDKASRFSEALEMDRALLRNVQSELAGRNAFIREVGEIVGRTAIIAGQPVKLNYKHHAKRGEMRGYGDGSIIVEPYQPLSFSLSDSIEHASLTRVQYETMELLDVSVVADQMRDMMQAYVTLADETLVYGITRSALGKLSRNELVHRLTSEIATQLAVALADHVKRRFP